MKELNLVIQAEPPNVNNYVKHTRSGRHYKTKAAHSWLEEVGIAVCAWKLSCDPYNEEVLVPGKAHEVTYVVYQGFKSKGDVDNYAKCILDALVDCGVLKSDASIVSLHAHKLRDRNKPRTEIKVRAL